MSPKASVSAMSLGGGTPAVAKWRTGPVRATVSLVKPASRSSHPAVVPLPAGKPRQQPTYIPVFARPPPKAAWPVLGPC